MSDQDSCEIDDISLDLTYGVKLEGKSFPDFDFSDISGLRNPFSKSNDESEGLDASNSDLFNSYAQNMRPESVPKAFKRTPVCKQFDSLHSTLFEIGSKRHECQMKKFTSLPECLTYFDTQPVMLRNSRPRLTSEKLQVPFVSPVRASTPIMLPKHTDFDGNLTQKKYTEKEFSRILEIEEQRLKAKFSEKYKTIETQFAEKARTVEQEISRLMRDSKELTRISLLLQCIMRKISTNNDEKMSKLYFLERKREFLKENIQDASKKLKSFKLSFSEILDKYEHYKRMVDFCKEHEKQLKHKIADVDYALSQQMHNNFILQEANQIVFHAGRKSVEKAKEVAEMEVQALNTQLRMAQRKVVDLESDFIQSKK